MERPPVEDRDSITTPKRMWLRLSLQLGLAWLTLFASASVLLGQGGGRARDAAAEEFRRIVKRRDSLPDDARLRWLFAAFDTAARSRGRGQPEDTVTDASGERAIYRRARPDWDQGDLARWESALTALNSIDTARLSARDALSHDIMRSEVTRKIALARTPPLYMPLTNHFGLHHIIWFYGSEFLPSETVADYEIILAHLNGVALEIDDMMRAMRRARANGVMPPEAIMTNVENALRQAIVDDPVKSGYLAKFSSFPESIPAAEQARLRTIAIRIYVTKIRPAYERLLAYATKSYIPGATETVGLSALRGGPERYALIVQLRAAHPGLTPARLHRMALDDVVRQRAAIDSVRVAVGYRGSYGEFLEFLRTDRRFQFADSAAYIRAARDIAKRVDANIFKMFRTVPRLPFGIEGVRAVGGGVYVRGSLTEGRPGTVRLFVSGERPGPTWRLPTLMLHEGVPGHHFSHALNLERELPPVQRLGSVDAFTEGWAMYAEGMATALGVDGDEYSAVGPLAGSLWRAIRAVMDTGVHGLGWSWQEAVDYARENSPQAQPQIESELMAMITTPGFALSYKLGEWKFLELRAFAERELGASFDVRAFNDALLENGEMPMDLLDRHMRAWVARHRPALR